MGRVGELKDSLFVIGVPLATDIKDGPNRAIWIASAGLQRPIRITRQ